ncbi:MAG: hypothetical protein ABI821_00275 [Pseudomonadota bacterium]
MVAVVRSRFYSHAALALAALILVAFARTYYLRFLSDLPPLSMLMQVHGLLFTAWVVLFVTQARLIAAHRVDLHMKLGMAGAALAVAIFAVGVVTAIETAAVPGLRPSGRTGAQFVIIPLVSIVTFGMCVGAGIALRRRAGLHKRFMMLGMVAVLGPAIARLVFLVDQRKHVLLIQMLAIAVLIAWCLIADWRKHRVIHPVYAVGGFALVLSWPLRMALVGSDAWAPIARWLVSLT